MSDFELKQAAELADVDGNAVRLYTLASCYNCADFLLCLHPLCYAVLCMCCAYIDWSSAWEECKKLGLKWGGRGRGGRATNRQTMQPRDVFVEGSTYYYLLL
jgi:hypothetical protein